LSPKSGFICQKTLCTVVYIVKNNFGSMFFKIQTVMMGVPDSFLVFLQSETERNQKHFASVSQNFFLPVLLGFA